MSEPLTIAVSMMTDLETPCPTPLWLTLSPDALAALADAIVGTGIVRTYRKAFCRRGHARIPANLYMYSSGYGACRICKAEKDRGTRAKKK